ncbi:hypothetical protein H6F47_23155 [Sphaerospermopsis sp. FACHB-1094]|uniref:hypothetical protein n=1 Tax=Sphaerospermopsis sp. FACHB-1094 TaxID=2692861 RepID=UPI001682B168|nr:hypothetical protein [Sphaerospermopsis sp. FACHB-1094]MBD2135232.1 hypothetical protein [Sphaerospermopsis sp. FACHB-1094]
MGRPRRNRLTDRVNYKLDRDIREILSRIAERQGRTEGAQVEQMILFYEACQRLNNEGESITMDAINAKVNQIWDELIANE